MNYYISDLHLFCTSQTQEGVNHDHRPFANVEEMHAHFLSRWNTKVTPLVGLVAQLKGKKVLVKGNHDDLSDYRYTKLFEEIVDYKEMSDNINGQAYKLVLSHYPILMWKNQHHGTILLYGHTHNSSEDTFFQKCIAEMNNSEDQRLRRHGDEKILAINVCACMPWINYEPRTLKEILGGI